MKVVVEERCRGKDEDKVREGRISRKQKKPLFRRSGGEVREVRNRLKTTGMDHKIVKQKKGDIPRHEPA